MHVDALLEANPQLTLCRECLLKPGADDDAGSNIIRDEEMTVCGDCGIIIGVAFDDALPQQHEGVSLLEDERVHAAVAPVDRRVELMVETGGGGGEDSKEEKIQQPKFVIRERQALTTSITTTRGSGKLLEDHLAVNRCDEKALNDNVLHKLLDELKEILLRLALDNNARLRGRCSELGENFLAIRTHRKLAVKAYRPLAAAIVIRAANELSLGIRRAELAMVMCERARVARMAWWSRELVRALVLPRLERARTLTGFVNRYSSRCDLTPGELSMIEGLLMFVIFLMEIGTFLPPVGINGHPYATEEVTKTVMWASHRLRPPMQPKGIGRVGVDGRVRRGKSVIKKPNRDYSWIRPLALKAQAISSIETTTAGGRHRLWVERVASPHARALLNGPKLPTHSEAKWPLNRAHPGTIAIGIVWAVTQLRSPIPTVASKGRGRKTVQPVRTANGGRTTQPKALYRMTQQQAEEMTGVDRVGLTRVQKEIRDMWHCFM